MELGIREKLANDLSSRFPLQLEGGVQCVTTKGVYCVSTHISRNTFVVLG